MSVKNISLFNIVRHSDQLNQTLNSKMQDRFGMVPFTYKAEFILANLCSGDNMNETYLLLFIYV